MSALDELISVARKLPTEDVEALLNIAREKSRQPAGHPPYIPIELKGLWRGVTITDEDIRQVRHEMWRTFEEPE